MTQQRGWLKYFNLSLLFIALCCASVSCFAQLDRGTISGIVTDPSGATVTGAKVTVTNISLGTQNSTVTTGGGDYSIPELPAGVYSVTVVAPGFKELIRTGITVSVGETARLDLKLAVGQATSSVTVTADAPLLQTDSAQNNVEVTTTNLNELPLNIPLIGAVRDPMSFAALVPGTIFGGWNDTHIEGSPAATYRVFMDGLDDTSAVKAAISDEQQPSVASLGSESLMVNDYSAQYGNGTGVFNYTSMSGTNKLHGSLFNYFQNEDLDAGQPFNNTSLGQKYNPVQRELDFGGTVGGPVVIPHVYNGHNKTFFFVAYEEYHNTQTLNDGTITVPTAAYLTGDLSSNLGSMITNNGTQQYDCLGRPMQNGQIYNPATLRLVTCAANASYNAGASGVYYEDPFPNNFIGAPSAWDPVALAVLKYMPAATSTALNHNYPNLEPNNKYQYLTSIQLDHYIGQKWHLMAYYMDEHSDKDNADDGINTEASTTRWNLTPAPQLYLNADFTETPNLVWHVGMDFTRHDALQDSAIQNFDVTSLGLDTAASVPPGGGKTFPIFSGITVDQNTVPNLGVNNAPFIDDNWYETASAMWVHGHHNFVFGGELRHQLMGTHNDLSTGSYGFGTGQTTTPSANGQNLYGGYLGDGFASFVLGQLSGASIGNDNIQWWHRLNKAIYANDTWKATHKLTVNLGLRWDFEPMQVTEGYEDTQFSPTVMNPTVGILGGAEYEGYGKDSLGQSRCNCVFEHNYNWMIQPRIGFNYQLDARTVVHAAWGFYSGPQLYMNEEGYNNQGFGFNQSYVTSPGPDLVAGEPAGTPGDTLKSGVPFTSAALTARDYNPGFWPSSPTSNNDPPNFIVPNNGRPPRYDQTDVGVQHQFATNLSVSASFINNWGVWLNSDGLTNTINELTPAMLSQKYGLNIDNPADYAMLLAPFSSQSRFALPYVGFNVNQPLAQALRPFPQMSGSPTDMYEHDGDWWYDGLQLKVDKRLSNGLSGGIGYMWSKNEGTISSTGTYTTAQPIQDPSLPPKSQKSLESIDQPLSLNFYFNYELPVFSFDQNGWKHALFSGWTTDGIFRYASGFPIQAPTTTSDSFSSLTSITFAQGRWPNRVPGEPLLLHSLNNHHLPATTTQFFNPAAWANPGTPAYGNAKPYYSDYRYARTPSEDLGFGKVIPIKEGVKFEIRGDLINVFNRWTYPGGSGSTSSFPNSTNPFGTSNGEPFGVYGTGGMASEGGAYPPRFASMVARFDF